MAVAEVGSLAIKVSPDLHGFRAELKREAEAAEKSLDPIKIRVELEKDDIAGEVRRYQREAKPVNIGVKIDGSKAKAEAKAVNQSIDREISDRQYVDVVVRESNLERTRQAIVNNLGRTIEPDIDFDSIKDKFESMKRPKVKINLDYDTSQLSHMTEKMCDAVAGQKVNLFDAQKMVRDFRLEMADMFNGVKDKFTVDVIPKLDTKGMDKEFKKQHYKMPMGVDMSKAAAGVQQFQDNMNRRGFTLRPNIDPVVDMQHMRDSFSKGMANMMKVKPLALKVDFDKEHMKANLSRHMAELGRMKLQNADITVGANLTKFRRDLFVAKQMLKIDKAKADWKALGQTITSVGERIKDASESVAKLVETRAISDPFKVLARSSGLRVLWDLHRAKFEAFANFDKIALKVGSLGIAFQTLGGVLAATAGNVLSWAKGLGEIALAGVALPGILAGIGVAGLSLANAMKDFKHQLPDVVSKYRTLRKEMSNDFWSKAKAPIREMVNRLFPELSRGMRKVSTEMGSFTGSFAKGLSGNFGGNLGGMFNNISTGIRNASRGMNGLTKGLRYLVQIGTDQLPALGKAFADISDKFGEWMQKMYSNGSLQVWVNQGASSLKALGSIVLDTLAIVGKLGSYAQEAGASTLQSLAKTVEGARNVVSSSGFKTVFVDMMSDVYAFTNAVGEALGSGIAKFVSNIGPTISEALRNLAGPMSETISNLFNGLSTDSAKRNFEIFFEGLRTGLKSVADVAEIIGAKFTIVLSLIGVAFKNLMPIVTSFADELAVVLSKIQQPATDLMNTMGASMSQVIAGMSPIIDVMANAFARLLTMLNPLAASFGGWGAVLSAAAPIIQGIANTLMNILEPVIQTIADHLPAMQQAWANLLTAIQPIMPVFEFLGKVIGTVAGLIVGVLMSAITSIIDGIAGFINGLTQMWTGFSQLFEGLKVMFTNLPEGIGLMLEGLKNIFFGALSAIWNAVVVWANVTLVGAIRGGVVKILTSWKGGWKAVKDFAVNAWGAIGSGVSSFIGRIVAWLRNGVNNMKAMWSAAWNAIKSFASAAWSIISSGMSAFVTRLITGFVRIYQRAKEIFGQVYSAAKSLASKFISVGSDMVRGLINGIRSMGSDAVGAITGVVTNAVDAAKRALGIRSPSRVFRSIGEFVSEGLAIGIRKNADMAVDAVSDMSKAIAGVPMNLSDVNVPTGEISLFSTGAFGAMSMGVSDGPVAGPQITQNFYESNVDAQESLRLLRMGIKTARMSGNYATI